MKIRGFVTTAAAALVCCVTLGCPPAENSDVPADVDLTVPADSNTTDAGTPVTEPTADNPPVVEETTVPADAE